MQIRRVRARWLATLSFSLSAAACSTRDGSPISADAGAVTLSDSGGMTVDARVEQVECDGKPVGATERRVRYAMTKVPANGTCVAQNQQRVCSEAGTWTEWTGDYQAEACTVADRAACDGKPHGTEESRKRYVAAMVPSDGQCAEETQTRTCNDGSWSGWSGSYTFETCEVQGEPGCGDTPHGTQQKRVRFEMAEVPYGATCKSEEQTRSCTRGAFSQWTGTFTFETCRVLDALSCGNAPHGTVEEQTRYEASLVEAGETCVSETQKRTCTNGTWNAWSGTFGAETCDVRGSRRCGDTASGEQQKRVRYQSALVPYGAQCVSEEQVRTCEDGTFSSWSGTHEADECEQQPPAGCGESKHGDTEQRTRFATATVAYGSSCTQETQTRTCDNGSWSAWSGTASFESCAVDLPIDCDGGKHGDTQTRTHYQSAQVPYGTSCAQETQTRTCNNGTWSAWSGTATFESCVVELPADCDGGKHGDTQARTRYQAAQVPYGTACAQETQTRTCNNGAWSAYTGTYTAENCSVAPPAPCGAYQHGDKQTRTRYASAFVPNGSSCVQEKQESTCTNGTWSSWTGTYTAETCRVRAKSCTDFSTNETILDGDVQTRLRYEEPFPSASCKSETQTRLCSDGTLGAWSGTYSSMGCAALPATSSNVASCRLYSSGLPQCIEYRGSDTSPYMASCSTGNWDPTRACPTTGTAWGKCTWDFGGVAQSVVQYAHVGADMKSQCMQTNGQWTDL